MSQLGKEENICEFNYAVSQSRDLLVLSRVSPVRTPVYRGAVVRLKARVEVV